MKGKTPAEREIIFSPEEGVGEQSEDRADQAGHQVHADDLSFVAGRACGR